MEATKDHIQALTDRIVEGFDPLQVILFGSQARGEGHARSDIDLLVVLPEVDDKRETSLAIRRAIKDLPGSKDVIVATPEESGGIVRHCLTNIPELRRRPFGAAHLLSSALSAAMRLKNAARTPGALPRFAQGAAPKLRSARFPAYLSDSA